MTDASFDLILASASPRRRELLELLGVPFRIEPSSYIEPPPPLTPVSLPDLVVELALNKARAVSAHSGPSWVLGADTLVSLDEDFGIPLGKPRDTADARRMLALLSGRDHFVFTGVALIAPGNASEGHTEATSLTKTRVRFRELSAKTIDDYIATGEPFDKAGAYGAQGFAAPFIERFEGDFYNVVGLPLCNLGKLMEKCGLDWSLLRGKPANANG